MIDLIRQIGEQIGLFFDLIISTFQNIVSVIYSLQQAVFILGSVQSYFPVFISLILSCGIVGLILKVIKAIPLA